MNLKDKVIVVTGGAHGIGAAMCRRFAAEQPRGIVVADIDMTSAEQVSQEVNGIAVQCDVANEADVQSLAGRARSEFGAIDLFCSNAGIVYKNAADSLHEDWDKIWRINVLGHVYAARAVVPDMLARGSGYLLQTASAAGLVSQLATVTYAVTKRAVISFAEWLSIAFHDRGIRVSCLCPLGVSTEMVDGDDNFSRFLQMTAVSPEQVAEDVVAGLESEQFLILPHPEVGQQLQRKGEDYERWLRDMRRLRRIVIPNA